MALSNNGKWLTSASLDGSARLWNLDSARHVLSYQGHAGNVTSLAISSDSNWLFTAGTDGTARLWHMELGKEMRVFQGHTREIVSLALSGDGKWMATGSADETVRIWDVASGKEVHVLPGHIGGVSSVTFSHDSKRLIAASQDGVTRIWDVDDGRFLCRLLAFPEASWAVYDDLGRFDASDADNRSLYWILGKATFPLGEFRESFFDPGLLGKYLNLNEKPLRVLNRTK